MAIETVPFPPPCETSDNNQPANTQGLSNFAQEVNTPGTKPNAAVKEGSGTTEATRVLMPNLFLDDRNGGKEITPPTGTQDSKADAQSEEKYYNKDGQRVYPHTDIPYPPGWFDKDGPGTKADATAANTASIARKDTLLPDLQIDQHNGTGERRGLDIQANGKTNYKDTAGKEQTISGSGKEQTGKVQYQYDSEGRVKAINMECGFKANNIQYKSGTTTVDSVEVQSDNSSKVLTYKRKEDNTWSVTDQNGVTSPRDWHGDIKMMPDGSYACKDMETRDGKAPDGRWDVCKQDGNVYSEKHNDDGSFQQFRKDSTVIDFDKQGRATRIAAANGDSRTFAYDERGLREISDKTSRGTSVWNRDNQEAGKERNHLVINSDGTFDYDRPDGNHVTEGTDFSRTTHDTMGRMTAVELSNGSSRQFKYKDGSKDLDSVVDLRQTENGAQTREWLAFQQKDGSTSLAFASPDGKVQTRHNIKLDESGNYSYRDDMGVDRSAKVGKLRDASDFPWSSDAVDDAREKFLEAVKPQMDEQRFARLQSMMKEFEKRESDLVEMRKELGDDVSKLPAEFDRKIAGTYENMAALVGPADPQKALYDQQTRVKLAENFMYHEADPGTVNQGSEGSCWIQAGHITGMVDHPDAMARLLKEISLTGTFTTLNTGEKDPTPRIYTFNRNRLAIGGHDWGGDWSIDTAGSTTNRSPVGMIFDESLSMMAGKPNSWAGTYPTTRQLMYMVTGDVVQASGNLPHSEAETLMRHGAYITYAPGHMRTRQLRKEGDHWNIIQDDQHGNWADRVIGRVTNLHDYLQKQQAYAANAAVNHFVPGAANTDTPFTPAGQQPYNQNHAQGNGQYAPARRFRFFRRGW